MDHQGLAKNGDITATGLDISEKTIYDTLAEPPQKEMGDFAFGLFTFAKALKKGPPMIAGILGKEFPASDLFSVQAAGPYLNFKFSNKAFAQGVLNPILDPYLTFNASAPAQPETAAPSTRGPPKASPAISNGGD